jgi:hypothetical protein
MGKLPSTRFVVRAFILIAIMEAANPAFAQNINNLLTIFGVDKQGALRHAALAEWRRLPPAEIACIDRELRQKGSSADALVRRGVKPSAAGLAELRSSCHRQFVQGVQTNSAQRGTDASQAGSPTPTVAASNPTEPKDAGVTPPSSTETSKDAGVTPPSSTESAKDAGVTPPSSTESAKDAGVTPPSSTESAKDAGVTSSSSADSVGQVAKDQMQQLKDSLPESGLMGWLSKAFLVAVIAMTVLLGTVVYLFIRWRSTGQRAVALSLSEKNSEGEVGKALLETTVGKTGEVVVPLAHKMIQLPDQTRQGANSVYSSKTVPANEEVLPDTVSIQTSGLSATGSSAVENVAQLAKLYAMGTPSEKEFQLLKELIPQSLGDPQERS